MRDRSCACCGHEFEYRRGPEGFVGTEVQHTSSLYGSHPWILLCKGCYQEEELSIEDAGSNDIPNLLATYKVPADDD